MRIILSILTLLAFSLANGQALERKVIIENGEFYYVTVDDNYQLGTLYRGKINAPLSEAKALALPAGRGISAQTNPLAWDLSGADMYAINFMDHSLNDRNESIKKIALGGLKAWSEGVEITDMIMQSVDQNMYVLNEPYLFTTQRSPYLNHFYFDARMVGDDYWMVVTNNEELVVWKYDGANWKHSEVAKFPVSNYFSLVNSNGSLLMVDAEGEVYTVDLTGVKVNIEIKNTLKPLGVSLKDVVIVENRDANKVTYLKSGHLNYEKSLTEILNEAAINLTSNK